MLRHFGPDQSGGLTDQQTDMLLAWLTVYINSSPVLQQERRCNYREVMYLIKLELLDEAMTSLVVAVNWQKEKKSMVMV